MDGSRGHEQAGRAVWARAVVVPAAAAAVAATLALPALAGAHGAVPQRMGERALQAFETRLLGAEHAAEHAAVRAGARRAARRRRAHPRKAGRLRGAPATRGSGRERRRLSAAGPPDVVGAWDGSPRTITRNGRANESLPAIHAILLPTGKVLMFGPPLGPSTPREPRVNESAAVLLDPVSRTFEDVPPPVDPRTGKRSNIYCASASLMSDGRVLVMGGYLDYDQTTAQQHQGPQPHLDVRSVDEGVAAPREPRRRQRSAGHHRRALVPEPDAHARRPDGRGDGHHGGRQREQLDRGGL